jgi:U4/U6 small nuclear ribonucleoprotein PRP3
LVLLPVVGIFLIDLLQREVPPIAEWWDAPLLPTGRYSDLDEFDPAYLKIRTENSPITIYIQHPIPIPPPGDKNKPVPKPLMLTKKVRIIDLDS